MSHISGVTVKTCQHYILTTASTPLTVLASLLLHLLLLVLKVHGLVNERADSRRVVERGEEGLSTTVVADLRELIRDRVRAV
jgi:hypothetical protein